ncbi:MAG: rod shape-determining protein MreC [Bacteroidota bacterium]
MRSLLRLLIRNYAFLLFILLEVISLVFVFNYNDFQKARYLNSANHLTGSVYNSFSSVIQYFRLGKINAELSKENAELRNSLGYYSSRGVQSDTLTGFADTSFQYTSARVINNSVNKQHNYITLNRGKKHGIKPDQGVISGNSIVGVVTSVSESYSMGLSVLNLRWSISAKLKKSGFYGSLVWDGKDYRVADFLEIPFHVELSVGDTLVTSGYSSVFPEGFNVGTVESFTQPQGENYYNIKVLLSTDFKSVAYVKVIDNIHSEELNELKQTTEFGDDNN